MDLLDISRSMTGAATEMLGVALRNIEQCNEQQLQWARIALEQNDRFMNHLREAKDINEFLLAQSQFAFSQAARGTEAWWRIFRTLQDGGLAAMSRAETEVGQFTRVVRESFDQAIRTMEGTRRTGWSGAERRKASVTAFPGPERRKAA